MSQPSNKVKKALGSSQNGKGSKPRRVDLKKFADNYKQINWSK